MTNSRFAPSAVPEAGAAPTCPGNRLLLRTIVLTNFLPPYRVPLLRALRDSVQQLRVLVSTRMEGNRDWDVQWDDLDVVKQRTLTFQSQWRHPSGFGERVYVHVPIDTFGQMRRYAPEVIISGEMGARSVFAALYKTLNTHVKLILWATVSEHSERGRGRLRSILRRWLLSRADAVLVNGESGARYVAAFGVPKERVFRVPYTTRVDEFTECSLRRDGTAARRLLFVGQLIERKGLLPLFEALARWCRSHPDQVADLWIVGGGPLREGLSQYPRPTNFQLTMLGPVPYDTLPSIYAQCGVLVFPTLADEWGIVVNEALAAGLPVLGSSYSQAVEELIVHGQNGWLIQPDQAASLDDMLTQVFETPVERLEEMREIARKNALALTPRSAAAGIVAALEQACA